MDILSAFGEYHKLMEPMPCIGLAYIASSCQKAGHEVFMLDNFVEKKPFEDIVESVKSFGADIVGISMLTPTANSTEALGHYIKTRLPSVKVVFGNLHASLFAENLINRGACDAVVHGEGEIIFPRLIDAFLNKSDISKIQGISYKGEEGIVFTGISDPIEDLDALPRPAWELFP